jgi:hypothetical protein
VPRLTKRWAKSIRPAARHTERKRYSIGGCSALMDGGVYDYECRMGGAVKARSSRGRFCLLPLSLSPCSLALCVALAAAHTQKARKLLRKAITVVGGTGIATRVPSQKPLAWPRRADYTKASAADRVLTPLLGQFITFHLPRRSIDAHAVTSRSTLPMRDKGVEHPLSGTRWNNCTLRNVLAMICLVEI